MMMKMSQITIDLDSLNATELAYLSRMRIGQQEREMITIELIGNCGPVATHYLQAAALADINTLEMRAQ